jgi:hypothetical protein
MKFNSTEVFGWIGAIIIILGIVYVIHWCYGYSRWVPPPAPVVHVETPKIPIYPTNGKE